MENENISILDWPPNSPDLNIIENIWPILSSHVYKDQKRLSNLSMLKQRISEAFTVYNETQRSISETLYSTVTTRLIDIIEKRGERLKN